MRAIDLVKLHACKEAIDYTSQFKSQREAWDNCPRGDWMLWLASKLHIDKRKLTLAKGKCAETVIHLMKDQRSSDAVKAAIDYGNGLINDEKLNATAYAAYAAAAYTENKLKTANICREILTDEIFN